MFRMQRLATPLSQRRCAGRDSSTEKRDWRPYRASAVTVTMPCWCQDYPEVRLSPMACGAGRARCAICASVEALGERIESVRKVNAPVPDSNGKVIHKHTARPLCINANTCRIQTFANQQRQKSAAEDEGLMDRSAECAAGGFDVI